MDYLEDNNNTNSTLAIFTISQCLLKPANPPLIITINRMRV